MKKIKPISLIVSISLLHLSSFATGYDEIDKNASLTVGVHHRTESANFRTWGFSDASMFYKLTVSHDYTCVFIKDKTEITSGTKIEFTQDISSGKSQTFTDAHHLSTPLSFSIAMNGELRTGGEGGDDRITWFGDANSKFYFLQAASAGHSYRTATIAAAKSVNFISKEQTSAVDSLWEIAGHQYGQDGKSSEKTIVGLLAGESNSFDQSTAKLKPGHYSIKGKLYSKQSITDSGAIEIVQVDVQDKETLCFDDFTGFEPKELYYEERGKGRAAEVYALIPYNSLGKLHLKLNPSPIHYDIITRSSSSSEIFESGDFHVDTGTISFKLRNDTLVTAKVKSPSQAITKDVRFINVSPNNVTSIDINAINNIFSQVSVIVDPIYGPSMTGHVPTGTNGKWLYDNLLGIINSNPSPSGIYTVFLMPGEYYVKGYSGLALNVGSSYAFIFNGYSDSRLIAHELGHCFGLKDEYSFIIENDEVKRIFKPDDDNDNLMVGGHKLRHHQWSDINSSIPR